MDDLRRDADDLARYCAELNRRLAQAGLRDVTELSTLFEQLRRAVEAVSAAELAWAEERVQRLIERLVQLDARVLALRTLKAALDRMPGAAR